MSHKLKRIHDVTEGCSYFVSEVFEEFLKEHFAELFDGKVFVVHFEGKAKEVFMTNVLSICLRDCEEEV